MTQALSEEQKKKAFTTQEFVNWLATKDPQETYIYARGQNCAIAQFVKETGRGKDPCVWDAEFQPEFENSERIPLPPHADRIASGGVYGFLRGSTEFVTFGAALNYAARVGIKPETEPVPA